MGSSVIDYFTSGIGDTWDETINYWTKENAVSDAVDTVVWSVENPDIVAEATKKGIKKSADELSTAVSQDTYKLLILLAAGGMIYFSFFKKKGK